MSLYECACVSVIGKVTYASVNLRISVYSKYVCLSVPVSLPFVILPVAFAIGLYVM